MSEQKQKQKQQQLAGASDVSLAYVDKVDDLPPWLGKDSPAEFFHVKMQPYHDELEDIHRALEYALRIDPSKYGGFLVLATRGEVLVGALAMLETGMSGYIPDHILLFVAVEPDLRGQGIGRRICEFAFEHCDGDVKLHVETENPARRLYERLGMTNKYLEMRLKRAPV